MIGVVVCKLEPHRGGPLRGYIAMLAVEKHHRGKGIATKLVCMAVDAMIAKGADEVRFFLFFFFFSPLSSKTSFPHMTTALLNLFWVDIYLFTSADCFGDRDG